MSFFCMFTARVTTSQGGSLHLFSSREAEYEQRAQLLKKLSFTIFCSETDQYQRYMPDIQGTRAVAVTPGPLLLEPSRKISHEAMWEIHS